MILFLSFSGKKLYNITEGGGLYVTNVDCTVFDSCLCGVCVFFRGKEVF